MYAEGSRISCAYFAAFFLPGAHAAGEGARIGFTVPRAFGKAVKRNRAKRRLRELLRMRLAQLAPGSELVLNPRRQALDASPQDLEQAVERLIARCKRS